MVATLGIIALLLLIGCIILALLLNDVAKWNRNLREDNDDLRRSRQRQFEDFAARIRELNQEFAEVQQERDTLADLNEKFKADADAETAHCRTLEKQITTMQQELNDVHAKATDLIERLDTAKKACEHPYGGRCSADAE